MEMSQAILDVEEGVLGELGWVGLSWVGLGVVEAESRIG